MRDVVAILSETQSRPVTVRLAELAAERPVAIRLRRDGAQRKIGSCGKLALDRQARIVDDRGRDLSPGEKCRESNSRSEVVPRVLERCDGKPPQGRVRWMALFEGRLARFTHPREIVFLDSLPRNVMGKVLKFELRARARTASQLS